MMKKTEKVSFYKFFKKFPNEQSARLYFPDFDGLIFLGGYN